MMSALAPKTDMRGATRNVRYGPIADILGRNRLGKLGRYGEPRGGALACIRRNACTKQFLPGAPLR
jgi:hypothetical protein